MPWGMRKVLKWIKDEYNNPPVLITENGYSDHGELQDHKRINYYTASNMLSALFWYVFWMRSMIISLNFYYIFLLDHTCHLQTSIIFSRALVTFMLCISTFIIKLFLDSLDLNRISEWIFLCGMVETIVIWNVCVNIRYKENQVCFSEFDKLYLHQLLSCLEDKITLKKHTFLGHCLHKNENQFTFHIKIYRLYPISNKNIYFRQFYHSLFA